MSLFSSLQTLSLPFPPLLILLEEHLPPQKLPLWPRPPHQHTQVWSQTYTRMSLVIVMLVHNCVNVQIKPWGKLIVAKDTPVKPQRLHPSADCALVVTVVLINYSQHGKYFMNCKPWSLWYCQLCTLYCMGHMLCGVCASVLAVVWTNLLQSNLHYK